jgi:hypothetical protein
MTKRFGAIEKNRENKYVDILLPLENNFLKTNRMYGINDGKKAIEAIHICLLIIDGYLNQVEYDLEPYITDANEPFLTALLMCFDPFTNEYLKPHAEEQCDLHSKEGLHDYFETPVKCLLRIEKSITLWTNELGAAGYFNFLEDQMGTSIPHNDKMDCAVIRLKDAGAFKDDSGTFPTWIRMK